MPTEQRFTCPFCGLCDLFAPDEICDCDDVPTAHPFGWGMFPAVHLPSMKVRLRLTCPGCTEMLRLMEAQLRLPLSSSGEGWLPVINETVHHEAKLN